MTSTYYENIIGNMAFFLPINTIESSPHRNPFDAITIPGNRKGLSDHRHPLLFISQEESDPRHDLQAVILLPPRAKLPMATGFPSVTVLNRIQLYNPSRVFIQHSPHEHDWRSPTRFLVDAFTMISKVMKAIGTKNVEN